VTNESHAIAELFDQLDEPGVALLLAKALGPEPQMRSIWFDRTRAFAPHRGRRSGFKDHELMLRISPLARAGLVDARTSWAGDEYGMPLDRVHEVLFEAHRRGLLEWVMKRAWQDPTKSYANGRWPSHGTAVGRMRALLVSGQLEAAFNTRDPEDARSRVVYLEPQTNWALRLFGTSPDLAWLRAAPKQAIEHYARGLGAWCCETFTPPDPRVLATLVEEIERRRRAGGTSRVPIELARAVTLTGDADQVEALQGTLGSVWGQKQAILEAFVGGDLAGTYELGCALLDASRAKRPSIGELEGFAFMLSCVDASRRAIPEAWPRLEGELDAGAQRSAKRRDVTHGLLEQLWADVMGQGGGATKMDAVDGVFDDAYHEAPSWMAVLVGGLIARWRKVLPGPNLAAQIEHWAKRAVHPTPRALVPQTFAALVGAPIDPTSGAAGLLGAHAPTPMWTHLVAQLETMADRLREAAGPEAGVAFSPYVVWQLDAHPKYGLEITPRLISSPRSKQGRAMSTRALLNAPAGSTDAYDQIAMVRAEQTRADLEADHGLVVEAPGGHRWVMLNTLHALAGHPRVRGPEGQAVHIEHGSPTLVVEGDDEGARFAIEPAELFEAPIAYAWRGRDRIVVYEADEEVQDLLAVLGRVEGQRVPPEAVPRVRSILTQLASKFSLVGRGSIDLEGEQTQAHVGIDVDLSWKDPTLEISLAVRPLGPSGPRCSPGEGPSLVKADVDGELRSTQRDLVAEVDALAAALDACPRLADLEVEPDGTRFVMGYDDAIPLVAEVTEAAKSGLVAIGWPRGKPLTMPCEYGSEAFEMTIRRGRPEWLAVDARLRVDEGDVIPWRMLVEHRLGRGRFVRLDDARVIALSEGLQRKLDALQRLDQRGKKRAKVRLPSGEAGLEAEAEIPELNLTIFDELLGGADGEKVSWEADVAARHAQIKAALSSRVAVPRGMRVKLRDYQKEGYHWMARLAAAGLGGILADDMGLGKTVQTLALLEARRKLGPALVVCPTTVGPNWKAEAERFTPALEVVTIGDVESDERLAVLEGLGANQVGVLSYGVLSRLGEEIDGLHVSTLVFDEAHALKNAKTRRAEAAAGIEADFRLGLTGTPVENHLGELWGVMDLCVPGLLGDEERFKREIARPIEDENDPRIASYLQALIRPFILRRTKDKVLAELPERTENVVLVEPLRHEKAWYEALRRSAAERVREINDKKGTKRGQARIAMLAEIMRLRRGAVDPRLVDDAAPRGAKLDLVAQRSAELVSAGHQVLVFTQFLDVISMLGARLQKAGVRTLELQGATPAKERAKRIAAFQRGEADVFLMSLKAGGIGVNLTAADYVLHVDPWWNPAVEDQATGRAHRMGQLRPVTVYRFCTASSIEPKILDLHDQKRELADDLLAGLEKSKRLDLEELRDLLMSGA